MVDNVSAIVGGDILFGASDLDDTFEEIQYYTDPFDFNMQIGDESSPSPFDLFPLSFVKTDASSVDELLSNSNFDIPQIFPSICTNLQQHILSNFSNPNDPNHHPCYSLNFSNPPDPVYHVRYVSEITSAPLDGSIVNTKKKTKKNVSGRYLKGTHGRHVTIDLPGDLPDCFEYYICVTRLTVPYQNISFVHPYPLYTAPKTKGHSDVISKEPASYFKLNKKDLCSRSKQFPNIMLTRIKQSELKKMEILHPFDKDIHAQSFMGDSPKNKIAIYQLKYSQLDFRLVAKCNKADFIDLNISCRSNALREEEGTECKKSAISPRL